MALSKDNEELKEEAENNKPFDYNEGSDSEGESPFPSRQRLQFDLNKAQEKINEQEQKIKELKENREVPEDYNDLEAERDQAIREKNEVEADNLDLTNKLKLKNQEITNKDKEIQRLKKEKSDKEIALNKTITGKNKELEELKKKYSRQGKLLDEEQTDNNKLTNKIEELENKIKVLEEGRVDFS